MELTCEFTEKKVNENCDDISLFRASRFAYRIGKPFLTDEDYDILFKRIEEQYPDTEELYHVYEEDKIIPEELLEYGIDRLDIEMFSSQRSIVRDFTYEKSQQLIAEDNKSILSVKTLEEEYAAIVKLGSGTYNFSPKMDGVFASAIYERIDETKFQLKCGKSRGEVTKSIDITEPISNVLPQIITLDTKEDSVKFTFEGTYINNQVKADGYQCQRSACQGVFSSTLNKKVFKYSNVIMICHGSSLDLNYKDTMEVAKNCGFNVVPFNTLEFDETMTIEEYETWSQGAKADVRYWSVVNEIEIDGIVAVKDNYVGDKDGLSGKKLYNKNVFAIKTGYWNNGEYESTIIGFDAEQQDSDISYKLMIAPVITTGGKTLTKLTDLRLRTIVESKMKIGDTVRFYYLNNTTPKFKEKVFEEGETNEESRGN